MSVVLLDRQLFDVASNWVTQSGDNVNKPASLLFMATQRSDGMLVQNALDKQFGGALVTYKRPLPSYNGKLLRYSAWHFKFLFVEETYENLARFENDVKTCVKTRPNANTPIRNVANYSTQWNRDTGEIQIDHDPPAWVGCGFFPQDTEPGKWHTLDFRYSFDEVALTFSIESIQWDDEFYAMPAEHKNIPMQTTNWETVAAMQIQNEGYQPGTVLVDFSEGVMAWSDQPIGVIPSKEIYDDISPEA